MKTIITIGRQFGSGGKEVGIRVAKELGIPFYDKELLQEAATQSCKNGFQTHDQCGGSGSQMLLTVDLQRVGNSHTQYTGMKQGQRTGDNGIHGYSFRQEHHGQGKNTDKNETVW